MPDDNFVPILNRLDRHRQERLWRLLVVCAVGWSFLSVYYLFTRRFVSGYICSAEVCFSLTLVALSLYSRFSRQAIVNIYLGLGLMGMIAEPILTGQSQTALFILCCAGSFAAFQLSTAAALCWIVTSLAMIMATHVCFPAAASAYLGSPLDWLLIQLVVPAVIFGLSYQAERTSTELAETLYAEQKTAEQLVAVTAELQERTRLLSLAEQVAHVGHWHWDLSTRSISLSREACRICGLEETEATRELSEFLECFDRLAATELKTCLEKASKCRDEFRVHTTLRRDGDVRYLSCAGFSEESSRGKITSIFGVLQDETDATVTQKQLREKANELNELAKFDPLTGLSNRHSFQQQLEDAVSRSNRTEREVALLLIDLDGFKEINDTMGHPCGDRVLQEVSTRLRSVVRNGDTVARIGGDEFTVIVNHVNNDLDISLVAGRIRRCISKPFELDGKNVFLAASVGAAVCPRHTDQLDELLAFADTAMYSAKARGVGVELYNANMTTEIVDRRTMEHNLQRAWEEKQFYLEYQPQVSTTTGVTGVEALLRWNNGLRTVSPLEFIPHLEQSGAIVKVGKWVIGKACRQAKKWQDDGIDVTVSVNISSVQFRDPDFVTNVWEALDSSGLDGKYLDLELTESVLIHDIQTTADILNFLKETGVSISIDDFGTGYSSLAYLRHLPLDRLKIDRTFVKDIPEGDDGTIALSIIVLARSLGMEVLAEGIESKAQLDVLIAQGCDLYQGFYFSRPLDVSACEKFIRKERVAAPETSGASL